MLPFPLLQSKKFLKLLFSGEKYELVGDTPLLGKRFKLWFLTIDFYFCECEPKIENVRGIHIIGWHIPKNRDVFEKIKKTGWFGPFGKYLPITNPVPYLDAQDPEYFKYWSKRKQIYRKAWLRQLEHKEIELIETNIDIFIENYLKSNLPKVVKKYNQKQMKKCFEIYNKDMLFNLIRDVKQNKIIAGVCMLADRELEQVIKEYSFTDKTYKSVGVGMVNMCISYAREKDLKFVNLTLINTNGHMTRSWRGFTKFKLEFNPIVTYFRQSYFKITFNK